MDEDETRGTFRPSSPLGKCLEYEPLNDIERFLLKQRINEQVDQNYCETGRLYEWGVLRVGNTLRGRCIHL